MPRITSAINIKQPHVELIPRGVKVREYRSRRSHKRERAYLYASQTPADDAKAWSLVGADPRALPVRRILGSVWNPHF